MKIFPKTFLVSLIFSRTLLAATLLGVSGYAICFLHDTLIHSSFFFFSLKSHRTGFHCTKAGRSLV